MMLTTREQLEAAGREAKFPKGTPADPTANMTPEQKAKWEAMNAEHGDKFKTANGDMLQYFADHPDKLAEKLMRDKNKNAAFDELADLDMDLTMGGLPVIAIDRDLAALELHARLAAIDRDAASQVGATIEEQLGGWNRLRAMLGAYYRQYLNDGYEFGFPNKTRSKGNHVVIKLTPEDTYNMEFFNTVFATAGRMRLPGKSKLVKKLNGVYVGEMARIFEQQTGWYLRMASDQQGVLAGIDADSGLLSRFDEGEKADPTENMSEEDAKKWRLQNLQHKDQFKKDKEAGGDELEAKFEEGVSADPTKDMSPEDAKKWKDENERNKDKFKQASVRLAKAGGHKTYKEYVRDWKAMSYPVSVKGKMLAEDAWQKLMGKQAGGFDEGSRIPDGWDSGHIDGEEEKAKADDGSEIPDGDGNKIKRAATINVGPVGMYRNRWPMVYLHGLAEKALGYDVVTFDKPPAQGTMQAILHDNDGGTHEAMIYSWKSSGMPAGLVVLKNDRKGMSEAQAEMSGGRMAREARTGLYGHTKRVQADCESCINKVQRSAQRIAKQAYGKHEKVAEFLSAHASRAESLPAQILVAALGEIGPKIAASEMPDEGEQKRAMRLAELRTARGGFKVTDGKQYKDTFSPADMKENYSSSHEVTKGTKDLKKGESFKTKDGWTFTKMGSGDTSEMLKKEHDKANKEAKLAPRGKAQVAIAKYLDNADVGFNTKLTDISRIPALRGVHFALIMSAVEQLQKKGYVEYDGVQITKLAAKTTKVLWSGVGTDYGWRVYLKPWNGEVFIMDARPGKGNHQAVDPKKAPTSVQKQYQDAVKKNKTAKVSDADAQTGEGIKQNGDKTAGVDLRCPNCGDNLGKDTENDRWAYCSNCGTDNIPNPRGEAQPGDKGPVRQQSYRNRRWAAAEEKTARKYGLYGFGDKVASLGLQACSDVRAETGRIAADLHRRRGAKHASITAFLDTHCKTAECRYSKLLHASYPDATSKFAAVQTPRTVAAWLTWED